MILILKTTQFTFHHLINLITHKFQCTSMKMKIKSITKLGLRRKFNFISQRFRVDIIKRKVELAHRKREKDILRLIPENLIIELNEEVRKWVSCSKIILLFQTEHTWSAQQLCKYYKSDKVKGHTNEYADLMIEEHDHQNAIKRTYSEVKSIIKRKGDFGHLDDANVKTEELFDS